MNGDWSAWLRTDGSTVASRQMLSWASQQPGAFEAWEHCPRADWLVLGLVRSRTEWREVVACAAALVRRVQPQLPVNERRPRQALDAVEAWARGTAGHEPLFGIIAQMYDNARYIAETSADSARAGTHYDTAAASVAAARTAVRCLVLAAIGDHDAAHSAVEAVRYTAHAPAHLGVWRTEIPAAHEAMGAHIRSRRWPTRRPGRALHRQDPALQIAWDWATQREVVDELTTVQLLAAMSAAHTLGQLVAKRDLARSQALAAVAEQLAVAPQPLEQLAQVHRILSGS